jgi:hypothetical protein
MTLDVAIITWQPEGIERVAAMDLPRVDGVCYVVSWQKHDGAAVPEALLRDDVRVYRTESMSVAANRNNALEHCTADIVLNGDDDLVYSRDGLLSVIETFERDSEVEFACFRFEFEGRGLTKPYPQEVCDLRRMPKGLWFGTIEMAVRRSSHAGALRFDLRFGPGAEFLGGGEDEFYLMTARHSGYVCRFYPITIGEHPGKTHVSQRIENAAIVRGFGAIIAKEYGVTVLPRLVLKAVRLSRSGQYPFWRAVVELTRGWWYVCVK